MKVATIILHYGSLITTKDCLTALRPKLAGSPLYLVNQTPEIDLSSLAQIIPNLTILTPTANLGFAGGVNLALTSFSLDACDAILLLNNDVSFESGTLPQLTRHLQSDPRIGAVAPLLHHPKGYDWGGSLSRWTGLVRHRNWPNPPKTAQVVTHLSAAAVLLRTSILKQHGLLDPRFFMYYEDVDLCLRLTQANYKLLITPEVVCQHRTSSSTRLLMRTLYEWRSHFAFVRKHLFRPILPTAFFVDLFLYPLFVFKSLFKQ